MKRVKSVAVIVNMDKASAPKHLQEILSFLKRKGHAPLVQKRDGEKLLNRIPTKKLKGIDICVVLGGDGTVLSACRQIAPLKIPLLAVHMGGFGFLTEVEPHEFEEAWEKFLHGEYFLDKRMMLEVRVLPAQKKFFCLNDAVLTQGGFSRISHFKISVGKRLATTYASDGMIVSTPTGSTAYNLSAAGPLLQPGLTLLIINAICAHTLYARPLVVSGNEVVTIKAAGAVRPLALTVDGQEGVTLGEGDKVRIRKAPFSAKLIRFNDNFFYAKLKAKLRWGTEID